MTPEQRKGDGDGDELIEDLEAPGETQRDVVGGGMRCSPGPSCGSPSAVCGLSDSCVSTAVNCELNSHRIVIYEQ